MMSDEALRTEFEAARLAGDHDTMARVGPLIWPDDGAPPPAPAPSPAADPPRDAQKLSAAEFARQQREIYLAMEQTHAGSPRMKELEASLEGLFQGQYGEAPAAPAGMTPEAFSLAERVSFPDGTDEAVRDGMLALAWAEDVPVPEIQAAIRDLAQARPMAPAHVRRELEAEYGYRLPTVLQTADEVHVTLPPALQQAIEDRDLFSSPVVIRHLVALREWRQRGRRSSQ
jgi:hypothetical protein